MKQQCFSSLRNQKKQLLNFHKILWVSYKIEAQKIANLLNDASNEESKFATKTWYVIDIQTKKGKNKRGDTETIKSSLCDYSDAFILVTGNIKVNANNNTDVACVHYFLYVQQKIMYCLLTKQIIFTLQCLCTYWLKTAIIIQIRQEVYGSLKEISYW